MPSFDVVSKVDAHELANAVDQTNREVTARFDFKGSDAKVTLNESDVQLQAETEFQIKQMQDIFFQKTAKRGIDIGSLESKEIQLQGKRAQQTINIKQGVDQETGKKIIKFIKDSKVKAQASIQGDQVRVSGKKKDDLQEVIALLRRADINLPLQFINFRD